MDEFYMYQPTASVKLVMVPSPNARWFKHNCMSSSTTCSWTWQIMCGTTHMVALARSSSAWTLYYLDQFYVFVTSAPFAPMTPWRFPAPTASCVDTSLPATPTTTSTNGIPSCGYLDQGCNTHHSQLCHHRHKGLSPSIRTSLVSSTIQAHSIWHHPWCSRYYCRGVSLLVSTFSFSPDWPSMMLRLFTSPPLRLSGVVLDIYLVVLDVMWFV
jgi:hypothetical protein